MSNNKVQNIIINGRNGDAVYMCEKHEYGRANFVVQRKQNNLYILPENEVKLQGRHFVYSSGYDYISYMSRIDDISSSNIISSDAWELRIYHPLNRKKDDFIIVSLTTIEGNRAQLFGGLYSECEINSYESKTYNHNTYSEYVSFLIPKEIYGYYIGDMIYVQLCPISDLKNGVYLLSEENNPSMCIFSHDIHMSIQASFGHSVSGIPGIITKSNISKSEFIQRYCPNESQINGITAELQISDTPTFSDNHIVYCNNINGISPGNKYLIEYFHNLVDVPNNKYDTYNNLIFTVLNNPERQYRISWSDIPGTLFARVIYYITIFDTTTEPCDYRFISNIITLDKSKLMYIIDKPSNIENIAMEFGNCWENYKKEYMLNINITNKIEDKQITTIQPIGNTSVILKPVFFRVYDLPNINIIQGIKQRVGINLQDYETKISSFILMIGDVRVMETERTGMYVIFNIDASDVDTSVTKYNILDQDGQYITGGNLYFS